ncbi:TonB-dependent receptor [Duganella sp. Leaf126]|uniref:TonB-dependent receptor plug domain-containing protein n=1 Tax=Duganella sp. Leaf126 TaxID=1736266 RepID=UPI0006F3B06F|nr:TonB-dependent receptor [Duganella sp. Leaf126]KQQ33326.1 TonB-dependent receptor [Duganella sp. Leaf126]
MHKFPPQLQRRLLSAAIGALCATTLTAHAQSADAPADTPAAAAPEATVVVTGTRVSNRSVLDTASAVDVISAKTLNNNGVTEVSESLSKVLPALNFPRPGLTDGTDTVRPVTLRGLAPDQVLVLVNSKRRHASSLVNVNGTIGRGSASTDINTLPAGIINTVEVLRDGAAAQYGSDAIAGVINFRLRENRSGGALTATGGVRKTEYSFNPVTPPTGLGLSVPTERQRTDGQTYTVGGWKGFALGDDGFLTVAAELKQQRHSERSAYDTRQFYPRVGNASSGAFDPRELTVNRYDTWSGDPNLKQATLFANAGQTLASGQKVYGWASYQRRASESAAFFRRPLQDENIAAIYPDGFLPVIEPTVTDFSAALGTTWSGQGWDYDTSLTYGKNKMAFDVTNTLNRSIGPISKTAFDAGGFAYEQLSANFSAVRPVELAVLPKPLNVAVGAEARWENYELWAGEPDSYRYGGALLTNGTPAAAGAQGFPGYRPENAVDKGRHATGAFIDLETNLTDKLLTSLAARAEHYSDFGSNVTGKLAARYDFAPAFALRGSVQNGFRAPSPQQQLYTSTSTNFIDGVPFDIVTLRPTDAAAAALGAKPLDAEKSVNFSLGAVLRFGALSITADAYRINIDNRIVLSENLNAANVRTYLASRGYAGIGGARFFINGVDTRTDGIDIVANYPWRSAAYGKFDFTLAGNYNKTDVKRVPETAELAALDPAPVLFGRANVISLEKGQPKNKVTASVNWEQAAWGASASATRYGSIVSAGTTAATDVTVSAQTIVNAEGRYALNKQTQLALGADNLFDIYPDGLPASLTSNAAAPFSNRAPFGRGGRFVYARVNYTF